MKYTTVLENKEFHFLLLGFVTNLIWEIVQMPLFSSYPEATFLGINIACIQASAGDAVMLVVAFWIVAGLLNSREWIFHLSIFRVILFLVPGLVFTILAEQLATGSLDRWKYGDLMPTLPFLGTGVSPIFQWLIIPPFLLWIVKKQLCKCESFSET